MLVDQTQAVDAQMLGDFAGWLDPAELVKVEDALRLANLVRDTGRDSPHGQSAGSELPHDVLVEAHDLFRRVHCQLAVKVLTDADVELSGEPPFGDRNRDLLSLLR